MKHPASYDSTPQTRRRMAKVRLKGGKAETLLAKALWQRGYRYRRNDRRLPGSPDVAILRHRIAVFVDGSFWHGRDWTARRARLKRNRAYWIEKIEENMARDRRNDRLLLQAGWTPVHFWEEEVLGDLAGCVEEIDGIVLDRLIARAEERLPPGEE